jgi:hypothetical protein
MLEATWVLMIKTLRRPQEPTPIPNSNLAQGLPARTSHLTMVVLLRETRPAAIKALNPQRTTPILRQRAKTVPHKKGAGVRTVRARMKRLVRPPTVGEAHPTMTKAAPRRPNRKGRQALRRTKEGTQGTAINLRTPLRLILLILLTADRIRIRDEQTMILTPWRRRPKSLTRMESPGAPGAHVSGEPTE